jgi:hypothetical protein
LREVGRFDPLDLRVKYGDESRDIVPVERGVRFPNRLPSAARDDAGSLMFPSRRSQALVVQRIPHHNDGAEL